MKVTKDGPLLQRRRKKVDVEMDITPMIDVVFLLLIFFIVCSTLGRNSIVQPPKAQYGVGVNPQTSVVLTMAGFENESTVYLGDTNGRQLSGDHQVQAEEILEAVQNGIKEGKTDVMIRADRRLHHGEVVRVESVATSVPGINLYVIVDDR